MHRRRAFLAATGLAVAGSSAGCLDSLPFVGDEPIEFAATAASVPDTTLEATGYQHNKTESVVIERTFEAGDQRQDVIVTNQQAEYDKAVALGVDEIADIGTEQRLRAAIFTVLSTPQVSVLDRTFNPVAEMDSAELAEMVQDRYGGIENMEQVDEQQLSVGGQETTVGEFETEAELVQAGVTVDLTMHIAEAVDSGEDLLVGIGGYPRQLREQERPNIVTLLDAVDHPAG